MQARYHRGSRAVVQLCSEISGVFLSSLGLTVGRKRSVAGSTSSGCHDSQGSHGSHDSHDSHDSHGCHGSHDNPHCHESHDSHDSHGCHDCHDWAGPDWLAPSPGWLSLSIIALSPIVATSALVVGLPHLMTFVMTSCSLQRSAHVYKEWQG